MITIDYLVLIAIFLIIFVIFFAIIFTLKQKYQNIINSYLLKISTLEELSKVEKENLKEKINFLENNKQQMKLEFENLANKLFDEKEKKSTTNLTFVLSSFKEQLDSFSKRVNDIYNDETKQRSSLLTEIKNLKEL
ncbi:DNA recombination protein RmuC, partial [Aliarcobacter butzleri]